jgi:hypothetical protein
MNGLPSNAPLTNIAKESLAMSKETGERTFRIVAMVMMAASGLATLLHAGRVIIRDMNSGKPRPSGVHPPPSPLPAADDRDEEIPAGPERSWVEKARVGDRTNAEGRRWAEHCGRQAAARRH